MPNEEWFTVKIHLIFIRNVIKFEINDAGLSVWAAPFARQGTARTLWTSRMRSERRTESQRGMNSN